MSSSAAALVPLRSRDEELSAWTGDRLELEECAVLGLFPQSSSDLLQDYDALLDASAKELDTTKRAAILKQAEQLMLEDTAVLPMLTWAPRIEGASTPSFSPPPVAFGEFRNSTGTVTFTDSTGATLGSAPITSGAASISWSPIATVTYVTAPPVMPAPPPPTMVTYTTTTTGPPPPPQVGGEGAAGRRCEQPTRQALRTHPQLPPPLVAEGGAPAGPEEEGDRKGERPRRR